MAGELQSSLRAVPAIPSKLEFAFFNAALRARCNTAGVDEVRLQGENDEGKMEFLPKMQ